MLGEGVVFGDKDVGTSLTAALCFVVKSGISMIAENHVTGAICDALV